MSHDDSSPTAASRAVADCLPAALRDATITRIAAGLSGAGVYRVEAGGATYVLKLAGQGEPAAAWHRTLAVERLASEAGLAPRIVHVDVDRRAVLSAFVVDRSFPRFYGDPRTHAAAVELLGRTIRRVHDLPLPPDVPRQDPRALLARVWAELDVGAAVPGFAQDAALRVLAEEPPADGRALVLAHDDLNPTNLIYDGRDLLFLDWATAGATHPFYDLATVAVYLRMSDDACRALLAAHDHAPVDVLPGRFRAERRLAAGLAGTLFLRLARQLGHPGATGAETVATTLALAEVYQRMRAGTLAVATADGQWTFGLALLAASLAS